MVMAKSSTANFTSACYGEGGERVNYWSTLKALLRKKPAKRFITEVVM